MTDLKDLLGLALDDGPAAAHAGALPGVHDDLARGRRLRRRRTRGRMLGASAAVAAVAVAVAVPALTAGPSAKPTAAASQPATAGVPHSAPAGASHPAAAGIRLVAYTGTQPPGYVVKVIPDNWVVQGSTPFALTIAPANAANKDPDYFLGKLVVTQESFDTSGAQGWTSARIPGHTAYYSVQDNTASLVIEQTASRWLLVQAPTSLHWTEQQEVQFGLGVTILSTAQEGKG
jgi:hypothetical protein